MQQLANVYIMKSGSTAFQVHTLYLSTPSIYSPAKHSFNRHFEKMSLRLVLASAFLFPLGILADATASEKVLGAALPAASSTYVDLLNASCAPILHSIAPNPSNWRLRR